MSAEAKTEAFFSPAMKFHMKDHNVTLQTLNREAKGVYLTLESFEPTAGAWAGVPVIKADTHPNMDLFDINPDEALKAVNGSIVGEVASPHIDMTGHPTLESVLALKDEAGLEALINQGNLSISTGFHCGKQEDITNQYGNAYASTKGPAIPHHVLVFVETPDPKHTPGDKGAAFHNTADDDALLLKAQDYISKGVRRLEYLNQKHDAKVTKMVDAITNQDPAPPAVDPQPAAPAAPAAAVQAAAETAVLAEDAIKEVIAAAVPLDLSKMGEELATALARIKELEALLAEATATNVTMMAEKADDAWREVKEMLPPGMVHTAETEKATRAEWVKDPHKISMTAMTFLATGEVPGEKSGDAFTMGPVSKKAHKVTVGAWDAAKGEYSDTLQ